MTFKSSILGSVLAYIQEKNLRQGRITLDRVGCRNNDL